METLGDKREKESKKSRLLALTLLALELLVDNLSIRV
jgi:hypothetical protein